MVLIKMEKIGVGLNILVEVGISILVIVALLVSLVFIINRATSKDVYPSGMDDYYDAMGNQPGIPTYMNKTP